MKSERGSFPGIATVDLLIGLVLALAFMFRLSILAMALESSNHKQDLLKNAALFLLRVEWPSDSRDDVDTYLQDPLNNLVFFRNLSSGLMTLTRDDTGAESNQMQLPDGRTIKSEFNQETVEIKGIVDAKFGEYKANVHMYAKRTDGPTKVLVSLYKRTSNEDVIIHSITITLDHKGQEETAFRFSLSKDGNVVGINRLPIKFVDK